eukprot:TRINITY_DN37717_c0_g2_i1.p1 TRINITY_DN37717_c0_g2~~TRINITY_DN37717_c0_g2_i1.p1  ORF type:complete len:107 (+),score=37.85 TRINITY_DN37717_c0_g2_i1:72-392(+)
MLARMAGPLRDTLAFLACLIVAAEARSKVPGWAPSPSGKGFFDVESPLELVWKTLKFMLAMSPFIVFGMMFCVWGRESEEEEKEKLEKARKGGDFGLTKKGMMKAA